MVWRYKCINSLEKRTKYGKKLSIELTGVKRLPMKALDEMIKYLKIQNDFNSFGKETTLYTDICKFKFFDPINIKVYFNWLSISEKAITFLKDEFTKNITLDELLSMKVALSQDDLFEDYDFSVDDIDFTKKGNNVIITNIRGRINEREEIL